MSTDNTFHLYPRPAFTNWKPEMAPASSFLAPAHVYVTRVELPPVPAACGGLVSPLPDYQIGRGFGQSLFSLEPYICPACQLCALSSTESLYMACIVFTGVTPYVVFLEDFKTREQVYLAVEY